MNTAKFVGYLRWFSVCLSLLMSPFSWAQGSPSTGWLTSPDHDAVKVKLAVTGEINPETRVLPALLTVQLKDEWKTYWRAPGEGGIPPRIDLASSKGIERINWHWPTPSEYYVQSIRIAGYKHQVTFPLEIVVSETTESAQLDAVFTLSSCTNICVLTDFPLQLNIDVNQLTPDSEQSFAFAQAMSQVPQPLRSAEVTRADYNTDDQRLTFEVSRASGWDSPQLFVHSDDKQLNEVVFKLVQQTVSVDRKRLIASFKASHWLELPELVNRRVSITVNDDPFGAAYTTQLDRSKSSTTNEALDSMTIWGALFAALLGGLILNMMPCVLPVLGIKVQSLIANSDASSRQVRYQFLATAMGVISTFIVIGALLGLLKLSGVRISWGMQFQNPWFIAVLAFITLAFAINLFGLYQIRLPQWLNQWALKSQRSSLLGHFSQGVFATVLATPCTAPFLGTAVAFALGAPIYLLLLIFFGLGVGMALPWLSIAAFPQTRKLLPKPGPWLKWVKPIFGALLLATSVWLFTLLTPHWLEASSESTSAEQTSERPWQTLSFKTIHQAVTQGKVVFVDVTADWCITCKANKLGVLEQEPVYSALAAPDLIRMRGDWTVRNDYITDYLRAYGQYGVPYNRVYGPGAPEGIELPIILTSEAVMQAIKEARNE